MKLVQQLEELLGHANISEAPASIVEEAHRWLQALQTAVRHADRVISGTLPVSSCDDVFAQVPWAQARAALKHLAQSLKLIAASKEQARTLGN